MGETEIGRQSLWEGIGSLFLFPHVCQMLGSVAF